MRKGKKSKPNKRTRSEAQTAFVRGFVATALLSALDGSGGTRGALTSSSLQRALKAGVAVAGGTAVAEALQERKPSRALFAIAAGALGLAILHRSLPPHTPAQANESHVQEEEVQQVQG